MKNKFVTAVTTAGLLAGILGSAFVPSVKAGVSTRAAAFTAASSAEDKNDTVAKIAYYSTSAFPQALFTVTPVAAGDAAENGVYELTVSGGTIKGCTVGVTGAGSTVTSNITTTTSCATTYTWAADGTITFNVTLQKLAAGAVATISIVDAAGDAITITNANKIKGQASTALAAKLNVAQSTVKWDADASGGADATALEDVTIAGVPYFATSGLFGSKAQFLGALKNGYGDALATSTVLVAEVTGDNVVACEATNDGAVSGTPDAMFTVTAVTDGLYQCAVTAIDGVEGAGGAWTVTVKTASGDLVATVKGGFLGQIASATVTAAATRIASGLNGDGSGADDFFTIVLKDAAGRSYAAADVKDSDSGIANLAWDAADATEADITAATVINGTTNGKFKYDGDICVTADAPTATGATETHKTQYTFLNGAGTKVLSNVISLDCGVDIGTALVVRSISMAASVVPGATVDASIFLEDANGNLAGFGDKLTADLALILTGGTNADLDEADGALENANYTTKAGGNIVVTLKAPATAGTTVTLSDPASDAIAKSIVQSDSFDNTIAASGRKVTVNFGPAAAKKKVTFVVEFASGTVRSYTRKANASGVAVFTSPFGKVYVTATFGDEISDTKYVK